MQADAQIFCECESQKAAAALKPCSQEENPVIPKNAGRNNWISKGDKRLKQADDGTRVAFSL